jgi:hypothetical protein
MVEDIRFLSNTPWPPVALADPQLERSSGTQVTLRFASRIAILALFVASGSYVAWKYDVFF